MVDFCTSKAGFIFEYNDGLYSVDKPSIKKDFCFGYGMFLTATREEFENAERCAEIARTSEDNFISANMKELNRTIERLESMADEMALEWAEGSHPVYMIENAEKYYSQESDCRLRGWSIVNTFDRVPVGEICNDIEFVNELIEAHLAVRADFEKRLKSYLKKYGLSNVNAWTYLID